MLIPAIALVVVVIITYIAKTAVPMFAIMVSALSLFPLIRAVHGARTVDIMTASSQQLGPAVLGAQAIHAATGKSVYSILDGVQLLVK